MRYLLCIPLLSLALACGSAKDGLSEVSDWDGGPTTCAPSGTNFSSNNHNYILYNDCSPLQGVSVALSVTQDIIASNGFSLQLNANGSASANISWQQYVISISPQGDVYGSVDNWDRNGQQVFNWWNPLYSLPQNSSGNYYVPVGYQFSISLTNDGDSNITGASYSITNGSGNVVANYDLKLSTLNQYDGGAYVTADTAPIRAFQLVVVGFDNSQNTVFTSGGGSIIYHAASTLLAVDTLPSCVSNYWTAETSNSLYGGLPEYQYSNDYVQSFSYCQ
jgi:hypothetical protein